LYNKLDTPYARLALRIRKYCDEILFPQVEKSIELLALPADVISIEDPLPSDLFDYHAPEINGFVPILQPIQQTKKATVVPSSSKKSTSPIYERKVTRSQTATPSKQQSYISLSCWLALPRKRSVLEVSDEHVVDQSKKLKVTGTNVKAQPTGPASTSRKIVKVDEDLQAAVEELKTVHKKNTFRSSAKKPLAFGKLAWGKIPGFPWFPLEVSRSYGMMILINLDRRSSAI
jgi:hypothetical protein